MPSVPQELITLYQWITYLTPIWGLLLLVFWTPLKKLYFKIVKKPVSDYNNRLDDIEGRLVQIDSDMQDRKAVSRALLHHEIFQTAKEALKNGSITEYELENLEELYLPYKKIGGNGTAEKLYSDCLKLPVKDIKRGDN